MWGSLLSLLLVEAEGNQETNGNDPETEVMGISDQNRWNELVDLNVEAG